MLNCSWKDATFTKIQTSIFTRILSTSRVLLRIHDLSSVETGRGPKKKSTLNSLFLITRSRRGVSYWPFNENSSSDELVLLQGKAKRTKLRRYVLSKSVEKSIVVLDEKAYVAAEKGAKNTSVVKRSKFFAPRDPREVACILVHLPGRDWFVTRIIIHQTGYLYCACTKLPYDPTLLRIFPPTRVFREA